MKNPGKTKGFEDTTTTTSNDTASAKGQKYNPNELPTLINKSQYSYEVRGDVSSALEVIESFPSDYSSATSDAATITFDLDHNISLLKYLLGLSENSYNNYHISFENKLRKLFANSVNENQGDVKSTKVVIMQKLILGHNLALKYLITNRPDEGVSLLLPLFQSSIVANDKSNSSKDDDDDEEEEEEEDMTEFDDMKCKIAFLLMDCMLDSCQIEIINEVLSWTQSYVSEVVKKQRKESLCSTLKFRLHCYKSRVLFLKSKYEQIIAIEKNIRMAKKELKSAMEIYHHKLTKQDGPTLRAKGSIGGESTIIDEGASLQESVTPSIGSMSNDPVQDATSTNSGHVLYAGDDNEMEKQSQFQLKILHRQNQCALYLKANLEHAKQNTKKSLKLCTEAQHCGVRQRDESLNRSNEDIEERSSDVQSAYHFNNLAIIHQAAGKLHLAMYYYSRSLSHIENIEKQGYTSVVEHNGFVNPIPLSQVLFNASLCAQQLNNFSVAHECMKRCVGASPTLFGNDPFCWLHMGESCVNYHVNLKRKSRRVNNESTSDRIDQTSTCSSISLHRAIECLNQCIALCNSSNDNHKQWYLDTARALLAYVWLEQNNPAQVINLADQMLNNVKPLSPAYNSMRHRATMRLYACEALYMMGHPKDAHDYLNDPDTKFIDGVDYSFLAAQLVSLDATKKNQLSRGEMKRMKNAKATIQIFSAATNLAIGHIDSAEKEARSACVDLAAHDDAVGMKDLRNEAHKTLIESLIRGGKVNEAIKFAKSLK